VTGRQSPPLNGLALNELRNIDLMRKSAKNKDIFDDLSFDENKNL
jgi:hypothetical protein